MEPTLENVTGALAAWRYQCANEIALHEAMGRALTAAGLTYEREVRLSPADRIDFLIGRVGVEVKVAGTAIAAVRQLQRYAHSDRVDALLLVTTSRKHDLGVARLGGKPVYLLQINGWMG